MSERIAGFLVFNGRGFLSLKKRDGGFWDFPKGHVENEYDIDAAIRELREETGIENFEIIPGFRKEIHYKGRDAVFFLAKTSESVTLSKEHTEFSWESKTSFDNQMELIESARKFLEHPSGLVVAVIGASRNEDKYGFKILKYLVNRGVRAIPVNPNASSVFHIKCYPSVRDVQEHIDIADVVVPPKVAVSVVKECMEAGVGMVWLQPGAESEEAIELCRKNGVRVIYNACIMEETEKGTNEFIL